LLILTLEKKETIEQQVIHFFLDRVPF
jgi:hypothetical protein